MGERGDAGCGQVPLYSHDGASGFGKRGVVFRSIPTGWAGGVKKGVAFYSRRERAGLGGHGGKGPAPGHISCAECPGARIIHKFFIVVGT